MNLNDADKYLKAHKNFEEWNALTEVEKEEQLEMAEIYLEHSLDLRAGTKDKPIYKHAVYEQAIHLVTFDNERYKLQQQGINSYKFDDMNFQMDHSIISPVVFDFLKKYTFKRLGEIV